MALPEPFSDIEHLQLTIRRYLNKQIRAAFRDKFGDGDTWEPEVGTTRGAMLRALLHEDSDPIAVTSARMMLYYFTFGKAQALHPTVVGMNKPTWDLEHYEVAYKPQVTLFFKQDSDAVPDNYHPVEANISFRLMNESTTTISQANVQMLANQIKNEIGLAQGYTFNKGKYLCKYKDKEHGYDFQLYTLNELEGEQVVRKIISIRNHVFDEKKFKVTVPKKNSDNVTENILILGKPTKKQRWRPTAKVRFMYAHLLIHNRPEPLCLVDRTGIKPNPIVKAY